MKRIFNIKTKKPPLIRPMVNVGCLIDIPTGNITKGRKGEMIVNGGLGVFDGIAGPPNNFKSRIARYLLLTASNRMSYSYPSPVHIYDTEDSMLSNPENIVNELNKYENLTEEAWSTGMFSIISKSDMLADEWVKEYLYPLVDEKSKSKEAVVEYTSFKETIGSDKPLKYLVPTFLAIDSLTKLEFSNTVDELEKGNLDNNTLEMRKGLLKSKLVGDMPRLSNKGGLYTIITAHMAKEIAIPTGPGMQTPTKAIQYLKHGDKIKGISGDGLYLTTHFWLAHMSKPLINQSTKEPEFPDKANDVKTDLHLVNLTLLRSKSGHSGINIELIVSQSEGILEDLTNFYYIKTHGNFGMEGNPRSYYFTWLPDIKLQRTTVRRKLKENMNLSRTVQIMADLLQLYSYKGNMREELFGDLLSEGIEKVPEKMLEKMKKKGIPLETVLNTRNWWTIDNYNSKLLPYLSTIDLLNWLNDKYVPFWYKDKKTK